jgi:hypothetical protein
MNAAPTPIYSYAYTAFAGKVESLTTFVGEIEAMDTTSARARIRAIHRCMGLTVPRTIRLAPPQFLRLHTEAPMRVRFHRNGKPVEDMDDVSAIRAQFPAAACA